MRISDWSSDVCSSDLSYFGSGRMVDGFFLNNQLTDFSWNPAAGPIPAANAIAGGKRPRSSMTPAILLDRDGNFVGAIGSPGGSSIRSEEHTPELQSLMRNSYAVFCVKNKTTHRTNTNQRVQKYT